jgi:PKD repeat protein
LPLFAVLLLAILLIHPAHESGAATLSVSVDGVGASTSKAGNLIDELGDGTQDFATSWLNNGSNATAWFTLDLGSEQLVDDVKLAPRANRSYTLDIYVGNTLSGGQVSGSPVATCTPTTGSTAVPTSLQSCAFSQTSGRYVTVKLASGSWLKFYGVEVWGGSSGGSGSSNIAPTAAFTATTYPGALIVDFDASSSSDPDGTITSYAWDFGDSNSATGVTSSHTYAAAGTYPVNLTVVDNESEPDDVSNNVTVSLEVGVSTKLPVTVNDVGASTSKAGNLIDELGDGTQDFATSWLNNGSNATAWFTLDLGSEQLVDDVKLAPRANRSYTLDIYVGNTLSGGQVSGSPVATCTPTTGSTAVPTSLQSCAFSQTSGRYVTVKLASGSWLKFYGVEVWGGGTNPPTIPNAPSALTAQAVSANRVDLGWTDNANNETGFKIERQEIVDGARTPVGPSSADPWPAEDWDDAANISDFDSDSGQDLSGAVWNPISDTLWVCRNGPGSSGSKFWVIADDGTGDYDVQYKNGNRGEWTGLGDAEGITFVDYDEELVYIITEGEERIKSYDVSVYGVVSIVRNYDTSAYLPKSGGLGAEGITFVPDNWLVLAGFVDADGNPYTSQNGMGGLMFVGHQNGGRIYVFDLNANADTFTFVGAFKTGFTETAGLEFDRSTGLLYIWHGSANDLEVTSLDSIVDGNERRLTQRGYFDLPGNANIEGLALPPAIDNLDWLFLTRDDGGADALRWFDQFDTGIQYDVLGWSEIAQVDSDIQAYSDTGVVANATYEYRVRAFNAQGDSDDSNIAQAQTPASRPAASGEPVLLAMRDGDVLSTGLGTRKFTTSEAYEGKRGLFVLTLVRIHDRRRFF